MGPGVRGLHACKLIIVRSNTNSKLFGSLVFQLYSKILIESMTDCGRRRKEIFTGLSLKTTADPLT